MNKNSEIIIQNSARRPMLNEHAIAYDVVFVINSNSKGWILEKFCKVLDRYTDLHCGYVYTERNDTITSPLPKARAYFFAHYSIAYWAMIKERQVFEADRYLWFTHPDPAKGIAFDDLAVALNACTRVFCMNSDHRRLLELIGVRRERIALAFGGADPQDFQPHKREGGRVGFVGAYYERKNPGKMLDLIRSMPDVEFILLAPDAGSVENKDLLWPAWSRFRELIQCPNLTYVEASYEEYPSYFEQMDVYVSLSSLEGGPIPVLEAMMANVIPVVTRTGFANDVIATGQNGYIIEIDAQVDEIAGIIRHALGDSVTDIRADGLHHTWQTFAEGVHRNLDQPTVPGRRIALADPSTIKSIFRGGWNAPDGSGVWTSEASARLAVRFRGQTAGRKLLTLSAWTVESREDGGVEMRVSVNGQVVARAMLTERPTHVSGEFELEHRDVDLPIRIEIETSKIDVPPDGDEGRAFGVKVEWIQVDDFVSQQLSAGTEIGFGKSGFGGELLQTGWHSAEDDGVWTNGTLGAVNLPFSPDQPPNGSLVVSGRALGIANRGSGNLHARIVTDAGEVVSQTSWPLKNDNSNAFELPFRDLHGNGTSHTLELSVDESVKPSKLYPDNKDERDLGFFLRTIRIKSGKLQPSSITAPLRWIMSSKRWGNRP